MDLKKKVIQYIQTQFFSFLFFMTATEERKTEPLVFCVLYMSMLLLLKNNMVSALCDWCESQIFLLYFFTYSYSLFCVGIGTEAVGVWFRYHIFQTSTSAQFLSGPWIFVFVFINFKAYHNWTNYYLTNE